MADEMTVQQKAARLAGAFLLITGVVFNEWVLARLFSPDGQLILPNRIAIAVFDVVCLILGWSLWRRKDMKILLKIGLSFVAVVMMVFLLEKLLVLRGPNLDRDNPHGSGSYRLSPNVSSRNIQTNSYGMRWREVERAKPSGRKRVAFVGDSFTFGCCADTVQKSFVGIFDTQMREHKIDALNFGVGGYGFPDMYLLLKEEVVTFQPDFVFLMFFNGNDFSDTYLTMEGDRVLGRERWSRAMQKVPPLYRGTLYERTFDALRRKKLYALYLNAKENLQKGEDIPVTPRDFMSPANFFVSSFWSRPSYPPIAEQARDLSIGFLDRMYRICKAHGIRFVIGSLPFSSQVYARQVAGPGYDIRFPQKYVEQFARENSIPYIDTLPAFRKFAQQTHKQLFAPDGHYNNEGHRIAGEAFVTFFRNHVEVAETQIASNKR